MKIQSALLLSALFSVPAEAKRVRIDLKPRGTSWLNQCAKEMGLPYPHRREHATWKEIQENVGRTEAELEALHASLKSAGVTKFDVCASKQCVFATMEDEDAIERLSQTAGIDTSHPIVHQVSIMDDSGPHKNNKPKQINNKKGSGNRRLDGSSGSNYFPTPTELNAALENQEIFIHRSSDLSSTLFDLDSLHFLAVPAICFPDKVENGTQLQLESKDGSISCPNASITITANPWKAKSMAVGKQLSETIFYEDLLLEGPCGELQEAECTEDSSYITADNSNIDAQDVSIAWTDSSMFRVLNLGDLFPKGQAYYSIDITWNDVNQNPILEVPSTYWNFMGQAVNDEWAAALGPAITPMYGNSVYNVPEGSRAAGLGVTALYNDAVNAFSQSALEKANSAFNLPTPTFELFTSKLFPAMNTSQCFNSNGDFINSNCGESDLDVQMISHYGAGAKFGFIPANETQSHDEYSNVPIFINYREAFMENDVYPDVLSLSWGGPMDYDEHVDMILSELVCAGVTILVASGDQGASEGGDHDVCSIERSVDVPASPAMYQWVTAVGATSEALHKNKVQPVACMGPLTQQITSTGKILSADEWPLPDFQAQAVKDYVGSDAFHDWLFEPAEIPNPGRGIPDVAAYGGFIPVVSEVVRNTTFYAENWGGTSAASPAFAGLLLQVRAALLDAPECDGRRVTFGHINPFLYWAKANHPSAFTDITVGNNVFNGQSLDEEINIENCGQGFQSAEGWDPVTGLGMMNFPGFVEAAKEYFCTGIRIGRKAGVRGSKKSENGNV